jgi:hypothetical protein
MLPPHPPASRPIGKKRPVAQGRSPIGKKAMGARRMRKPRLRVLQANGERMIERKRKENVRLC